MSYETVIGLEIHAQLRSASKIFCSCSTEFGAEPNTHTCPVCLGMPGMLPVLNREVVSMALKAALATGCTIPPRSVFARKNYFYPDLPKGFQISQYDKPLAEFGSLTIDTGDGPKRIGITRIHLEDDAGKNIHGENDADRAFSFVDFNRTGVPLIEIVSEPDLTSPEQAAEYLREFRRLVRYLDICDGNMEEGSFRCDANISMRPAGQKEFGVKTELKNMNSFRNVQHALEYEIHRQVDILESGGRIVQETRLFNADTGTTASMRSKEEAHDYRYFPEPDLLPLDVDRAWIDSVKTEMPELPRDRQQRFQKELGIPPYDAGVLTSEKPIADYYEAVVKAGADPKAASNWVMSEVLREIASHDQLPGFNVTPKNLAAMIGMIDSGAITGKIAKTVFAEMAKTGDAPDKITEREGLSVIADTDALAEIADQVIAANPKQVEQYRAGKEKVFGFFVGQAMKATGGKADPKALREILLTKLRG